MYVLTYVLDTASHHTLSVLWVGGCTQSSCQQKTHTTGQSMIVWDEALLSVIVVCSFSCTFPLCLLFLILIPPSPSPSSTRFPLPPFPSSPPFFSATQKGCLNMSPPQEATPQPPLGLLLCTVGEGHHKGVGPGMGRREIPQGPYLLLGDREGTPPNRLGHLRGVCMCVCACAYICVCTCKYVCASMDVASIVCSPASLSRCQTQDHFP